MKVYLRRLEEANHTEKKDRQYGKDNRQTTKRPVLRRGRVRVGRVGQPHFLLHAVGPITLESKLLLLRIYLPQAHEGLDYQKWTESSTEACCRMKYDRSLNTLSDRSDFILQLPSELCRKKQPV